MVIWKLTKKNWAISITFRFINTQPLQIKIKVIREEKLSVVARFLEMQKESTSI